jgi:hypothetical protein
VHALRTWIFALLLTLSLLPSMEGIELVVHLVQHGDLAHGERDGHENSALGSDEHGCTGTFHLCGCHTATALASTESSAQALYYPISHAACFRASGREGLGATAPPIRPPIA